MCGRERTYDEAILYVWQPKELRAYFSDVWQRKDLALNVARLKVSGSSRIAIWQKPLDPSRRGAIATITAQFARCK